MNMDVATAIMSIRVSTDQCLMAGKMILHKFKSQGLCFLASKILRRYEYTGALVMGRRKKIDVNTTSVRTLPEDKWIIAENAHEAIVTKDE